MVVVFCAQMQWAQSSCVGEQLPNHVSVASSTVGIHSVDTQITHDVAQAHDCQDCIQHCHLPIGLLLLAAPVAPITIGQLTPSDYLVNVTHEQLTDIERPKWAATIA